MSARSDQVKGHLEEILGIVTDDAELQAKGRADRHVGEAAERAERARARINASLTAATESVEYAVEQFTDSLHLTKAITPATDPDPPEPAATGSEAFIRSAVRPGPSRH